MNIIVCLKSVPSSETKVKIGADGKSLDTEDIVYEMNPYDEYAVEEALKSKEAHGGKVSILTLGSATATQSIRKALAMGADDAIHLVCEGAALADSGSIANLLADAIKDMEYDLIFCGKKAIDSDNHQIPNLLGELLGISAATAITSLELTSDTATVKRPIEGGEEEIILSLPAILSAEKGLNEPRYASLPGIMAAKKKEIDEREVSIGDGNIEIVALKMPPARAAGRIVGEGVGAVPELVRILRQEDKVI